MLQTMPTAFLLLLPLLGNAANQNPRYQFDKRCPKGLKIDPVGQARSLESGSRYYWNKMPSGSDVQDCGQLCCHDWSCEAFEFHEDGETAGDPSCPKGSPCCVFRDDIDPKESLNASFAHAMRTGVRSKLPSNPPPYPKSATIKSAKVDPKFLLAVNGDEFPTTWAADGNQYTGAGDNNQHDDPIGSPASFFKITGGPTELDCPDVHTSLTPSCKNITMMGSAIPIQGKEVLEFCEQWGPSNMSIPNIKSSSVISIDGIMYWAISCFNYGDDDDFNRQRYGPAWIISSEDNGATWNLNATAKNMFEGRLAAPRFVQYGRDYEDGPSEGWVYVYFPCTYGSSAFFENNDMMLLGRVQKDQLLNRTSYEFYNGMQPDGEPAWTLDDSIAVPVWNFPLMTSVQQINFHNKTDRFIFGNWAWISYDGHPRPDHSPDERNGRTGHQRTQLSLIEAPNPWGPFSVFYTDDDWEMDDGSSGAYTPVFPPAWMGDEDMWMVSTQCCIGSSHPNTPDNHYNFIVQHVEIEL